MSYAEVFLLVWALFATALAGFFWHTTKKAIQHISILVEGVHLIESGEMELVRENGVVKARKVNHE